MQTRGTELSQDATALIETHSQEGYPSDCKLDWTVEHIEAELQQGTHSSADAEYSMISLN